VVCMRATSISNVAAVPKGPEDTTEVDLAAGNVAASLGTAARGALDCSQRATLRLAISRTNSITLSVPS